jgi:hypothetical protein
MYLGQGEGLDHVADLHERRAVGGALEQRPLVDVDLEVGWRHGLQPVGVQVGEELTDGGHGPFGHWFSRLSARLPHCRLYRSVKS